MSIPRDTIANIVGTSITQTSRIAGGLLGDVYRVDFSDKSSLVAKVAHDGELALEGKMLTYLNQKSELPVPKVIHTDDDLLLMTYIETSGSITASVQEDAAQHVAALHNIRGEQYGLAFDTLIGALHQPNPHYEHWIDFFREQRLLHMADVAHNAGYLPTQTRTQIDQLAKKLDDLLLEPAYPSLIHGDMWGGNVLANHGKLAAFIDPAIYYAHPEIELAFTTLFSTFGTPFFDAYQHIRPIENGFFETRRDIYNLYPLLVHTALFAGGYPSQVARIVQRFI